MAKAKKSKTKAATKANITAKRVVKMRTKKVAKKAVPKGVKKKKSSAKKKKAAAVLPEIHVGRKRARSVRATVKKKIKRVAFKIAGDVKDKLTKMVNQVLPNPGGDGGAKG